MITFDDGYWDFEQHAWPILKRYGIPATLFVPTLYPDQPERTFWWDDLHQAMQHMPEKANLSAILSALGWSNRDNIQSHQQLRGYLKTLKHTEAIAKVKQLCSKLAVQPAINCIMSWEALRNLASEGLTLGAHTRTHALMDRIPLDEARAEAVGSLEDLEREIGRVPPIFAYPSGAVSDKVIGMLARERFVLAFATRRGINKVSRTHPLRIGRINIGPGTTLPILGARLLSWTTHLNWLQTPGKASP
jgi:peptidoglycan/xylan/chitin deacetylase (PgdA/CDA1 family)